MRRPILLQLAAFALLAGGSASAQARADLPVTRVVLFASGVGYLEHTGTVRGNGSAELPFKTAQINDVLKSLVLQDLDGGRVSTVTYPSMDPLSKTLRSFQVDITGHPGMAELLNQLRGAGVTVTVSGERVSGTVLGVENRTRAGEKGELVTVPTLNLLSGATIRSVELAAIGSLTLDDPQLQTELARALAALSQARDQDRKPVTVDFRGSGDRRVRVGYVVETPVWKTSYRLILDEKEARMQGWAIVENQTESDWTGVSLSLVSGRPISFMMDLYQPQYLTRPTVVPDQFAALQPQQYGRAIPTPAAPPAAGAGRGGRGASPLALDAVTAKAAFSVEALQLRAPTPSMMEAAASVESAATTGQLGELFQYTISNVTLPRQKSAMLPIVTDAVQVERVSIYNAAVLRSNPLTGARLRNTTDKHFQQGPVTVLDAGVYAGDARLDNVPPGQERFLSYGVDLDIAINDRRNSTTAATATGRIARGLMTLQRKTIATQEYLADNRADRDKTLIIEHPLRQGWRLADTAAPLESTPTLHRFRVPVPARRTTSFTVREEFVQNESIAVVDHDLAQLLAWSRNAELPRPLRDALARTAQLRQEVSALDRQIEQLTREVAAIAEEQGRIRENMKTVTANSAYHQRLLAKLNEQESAIERMQRERDELQRRRGAARQALEEYVAGLEIG